MAQIKAQALPTVFPNQAISFNGKTIHIAEEMNLTEMWKASGKTRSHKPFEWIRKEGATFISTLEEKAPVGRHLIRSVRGRTGGTFAHWQIGMEYARYLSPELATVCNQIVKDFVEAKPEIAMSVTARADKKGVAKIAKNAIDHTHDPEALAIIENRAKSKRMNIELNGEMRDHGAEPKTFTYVAAGNCLAVTNMLPRDIKRQAGKKNSTSARDLMDPLDLTIIMGLEAMQTKKLRESDADGHFEILQVTEPVTKYFKQMTARLGIQHQNWAR